MKSRVLAMLTAMATLTPAFTAPAFAQRSQGGTQPGFQGQGWARGRDQGPAFDRSDPRERALYARYTGRDAQWQFAFRDGYNAGLRAARIGRRANPTIEVQFRQADRGYTRNWGSRSWYVNQYRNAFRDGYERGFYDVAHRRTGFSLFFHWGR